MSIPIAHWSNNQLPKIIAALGLDPTTDRVDVSLERGCIPTITTRRQLSDQEFLAISKQWPPLPNESEGR